MPEKTKETSAFYIMNFSPLWRAVATHLKREEHITPALYVGKKEDAFLSGDLEGTAFYDVDSARQAIMPAHIEGFDKASLDQALLDHYAPHMPILFEMASRYNLGKQDGNYHQRRHYIWQMIRIWEGLFDHFAPDCVIAASMPHRVFDYLVYLICERRGTPFIALETTSIGHLVYVCDSVHDQSHAFDASLFKNRKLPALSQETDDFLNYVRKAGEDYRPYNVSLSGLFQSHTVETKTSLPERIKNALPQKLYLALLGLKIRLSGQARGKGGALFTYPDRLENVARPTKPAHLIDTVRLAARTHSHIKNAASWYKSHISDYDLARPYIYFPANFMPERSTVPDSGLFYDYALIFSILENALPPDWQILYKEHPRSFRIPVDRDNPRDVDFYLRLRDVCPRLTFLDTGLDSKALVRDANAVAIASGTTGWEAIARGKPVLLFGEYWYGRAPGVHRILGLEDARKAITIIQKTPEVPLEDVKTYLRRVEAVSRDLSYYYRDNVAERAYAAKGQNRTFSAEEQEFRKAFARKMGQALSTHLAEIKGKGKKAA